MRTEKQLETYKKIERIAYEILDEIISPVCGIGDIWVDIHLANIGCYADETEEKQIFKLIGEKYKLQNYNKEYDYPYNSFDSLFTIATVVLTEGESNETI